MSVLLRHKLWLLLAGIGLALIAGFLWFTHGKAEPDGPVGGTSDEGPPWFMEVSAEVGLRFTHDPGVVGDYFMPQIMGSGAALFDFDNDGRLDVLLLQGGGPSGAPNRLFHQQNDGTFTDVSKGSGLDFAGFNTGVAIGDINNDGLPDVLVTQYGGLKLLLNNGNGTFTDVSRLAGLDSIGWATSAAFLDFDRDGHLDLVVAHYVVNNPSTPCHDNAGHRDYCHPRQFPAAVTRLYRNRGFSLPNQVRFEDVTISSGLGKQPGPGLGVVCADFDGDGWPDIFVANDGRPNHLWINQKNGTFKEEALERGLAHDGMGRAPANMGVGIGDVDGDGLFDLFVTHLAEETHTLWKQGPRGFFRDRTVALGLAPAGSRGTGFGTVLGDFDNDGALDVAIVNGRVARGSPLGEGLGPHWSRYAQNNQLFANDGSGQFNDIARANPALCGEPGVFRGLACGDLGNRGRLDLLVTAVGGPARLFRNVAPRPGHWLGVRAVLPIGSGRVRDAHGAEITVHAGEKRWLRWVNPGSSYQCGNDPRAHFGLGAVQRIDRIHVRWPDGTGEEFPGPVVDRHVTLRKGEGKR